jgi:uncharacterized membrane protein
VIVGVIVAAGRAALAQCTYSVTFVGGFDCGPGWGNATLIPQKINDLGHATGHYICGAGWPRGFIYTPEDGVVPMGVIPNTFQIRPQAISNSDVIVGHIDLVGVPTQAFIWEKGEYTLLPPPKGAIWSYAYGVNDAGIVCGSAGNPGDLEACMWTGGVLEFLGPLPVKGSVAYDLNLNQQTVGQMGQVTINDLSTFDALGFLWENREVTALVPPVAWLGSKAKEIDQFGIAAGTGWFEDAGAPAGFAARGLLWEESNVLALDPLPGYLMGCAALASNSVQEVVGECRNNPGDGSEPFIWRDGAVHNVNELVDEGFDGLVYQAHSINESGTIVASGVDYRSGGWGMLILTPQTQSPADLNHDCHTNSSDLVLLLAQWGAASATAADFDGDGVVGPADLAALLAEWTD